MENRNEPILSIIVPAYNAEKTLHRCIESLLSQNNAAIEIIISNDGSTDGTQSIIDSCVQSNPCVSFVRDTNGGSCCARNRGIRAAAGRWITFVDSDDYVAPNIYSNVIQALIANEPDMLEYQYWVSTCGSDYAVAPNKLVKDAILDFDYLRDTIIPVALNISDKKEFFIANFVWNKVYKASIIREHGVMFDETRRKWEDRLFSLTFLQYARTYYSMSAYGYYYVCGNTQTLSGKFDPDSLRVIADSYRRYREMYGSKYNFANAYTTNYFCNLLIDVAKDQFAYPLAPADLKNMFSIFVDDETVQSLFSGYTAMEEEKLQICTAIQNRDTERIFAAFERYVSHIKKQERKTQQKNRVRHLLSKVKQVLLHK